MRLVSNKESVARGEASILAIVETLLAIALVFYLSTHFNTLRWLAVAMCVSPLLLLRTAESTRLCIKWWDRMKVKAIWLQEKSWVLWVLALLPWWGVMAVLVRACATIVASALAPFEAI